MFHFHVRLWLILLRMCKAVHFKALHTHMLFCTIREQTGKELRKVSKRMTEDLSKLFLRVEQPFWLKEKANRRLDVGLDHPMVNANVPSF